MERNNFAPVAPIHILEKMSRQTFGKYHLFLAHHVVAEKKRFRALVGKHTDITKGYMSDPSLRIIMDNSIVELGGAVDDNMILEAVQTVKTGLTTVVPCLPDVMGNGEQTLKDSLDAYDRWEDMNMYSSTGPGGYMYVIQADSWEQLTAIIDFLFISNRERYRNISTVGIPRYLMKQWATSRWEAIEYIAMATRHLGIHIHLLGFSEDIFDDVHCAAHRAVDGIDSAVPVRYQGTLTPGTTEAEIGPRGDWFENGTFTARAELNINNVRSWINYGL